MNTPSPCSDPACTYSTCVQSRNAKAYADMETTELQANCYRLHAALRDALVQLEVSPMVSGYSEVVKRARAALAKAGQS